MSIYNIITEIMDNYVRAKTEQFGGHPLKRTIDQVPVIFKEDLDLPENLSAVGSLGQGNWARIPWLAIFDTTLTTSTLRGYYIVLLFSDDMSKVYLTLNQGFTWFKENYPRDKYRSIEIVANVCRRKLGLKKPNIRLSQVSNDEKIRGYELGTITSVEFKKDKLSQDRLVKELKQYVNYLNNVVEMVGNDWEEFNREIANNIPTIIEYINHNYQEVYNNNIETVTTQREEFNETFPLNNLLNMSLNQFNQAGNTSSYANFIERKTGALGSGSLAVNRNRMFVETNGVFEATLSFFNTGKYEDLLTVEEKFEEFKRDLFALVSNFNMETYDPQQYLYGMNVFKFKSLRLYRLDAPLYGLVSTFNMQIILNHFNLTVSENRDAIQLDIEFTNYLNNLDETLVKKNTDIINLLIWDYFDIYIPKGRNYDEENEVENNTEEVKLMSIISLIENELTGNNVKQIILTGAPGTGKTYSAKEYIKWKLGEEYTESKQYKFVQFHQSYDYTDFVEGIRPLEQDGVMRFVKRDGIFKAFCRIASTDINPDNNYYFLIDEINRADLSKVFGEVMYCLEESYRGQDGRIDTQYQNLATYGITGADVFADGFYIPHNVIIIGTMNDIDRSVESFDFALRRRFRWINIKVNDILEESLSSIWNERPVLEGLVDRINMLNNVISGENGKKLGLDQNYHIGPAYFKDTGDLVLDEYLNKIWVSRVEPLLREYVRGRKSESVEKFLEDCRSALITTI